jgi:hypothetical protein
MMQVSADIEGFLETNVISCLRRHQLVGQQGALDSCELTKHKQYQAKLTNNFREEGNYKFVAFLARKLAKYVPYQANELAIHAVECVQTANEISPRFVAIDYLELLIDG